MQRLCLHILCLIVFLLGGPKLLRAEISEPDSLRVERIGTLRAVVDVRDYLEPSFCEGVKWTLRYLANHTDGLSMASKISFEVAEILPNGKQRIADMVEHPLHSDIHVLDLEEDE